MSDEDKDDRQHEPSEQKLRRAREKGDFPRTPEISAALSFLGFFALFGAVAGFLVPQWLAMASRLLGAEPWPTQPMDAAAAISGRSALWLVGALFVPLVLALSGYALQRAIRFTPSRLVPDLKKINPLKNAGQKFGKSGLTTFAMSLVKVLLVAVGGAFLFRRLVDRIVATGGAQGVPWVGGLSEILYEVVLLTFEIAVVFSLIDYIVKWFEHRRRNRMTRREVQDEYKESEGDPHLKQARRQRAVDIAMSSMLADVEKADVVIVNPTHYAVALEWKRGSARAGMCGQGRGRGGGPYSCACNRSWCADLV